MSCKGMSFKVVQNNSLKIFTAHREYRMSENRVERTDDGFHTKGPMFFAVANTNRIES